ncbi:MAG: hypothetical protein HRT61_01810 [Ekhidna sp.]|nr:hypothetical protein [Ekhidna sp.]
MGRLILLLSIFPSSILFGQKLTPTELREDFQIFKSSILDIHPGLYWYSDSLEITERFKVIEDQLVQAMELKDFYGQLQLFYASIRCGHSWMSMPWSWREPTDDGPFRIPLNFYLENDRIIVLRDLTNEQFLGEGHEVLSINGNSSQEIFQKLLPYTPTDGYAANRQRNLLAGNFSRYYQVHFGMDSIFEINLKIGGKEEIFQFEGLSNDEANQRSTKRYGRVAKSSSMLEFKQTENGLAYLRIKSFDKEDIRNGNQKFKQFLKDAFKEINASKTKKLIVDLRDNSGGEDNYGATLASYLLKTPFDYYLRMEAVTRKFNYNEYSYQKGFNTMGKLLKRDKTKPGFYTYNFSRQVKKQKPAKNPYTGELIILINGGTFSAASEVASILHTHRRAKFIGEETGGGYYGNNSAMMYGIQLPNSKINYYLPIIRYYLAVDHEPFIGHGLIPDIQIPQSYENYISPQDEVLDKAIEILKD